MNKIARRLLGVVITLATTLSCVVSVTAYAGTPLYDDYNYSSPQSFLSAVPYISKSYAEEDKSYVNDFLYAINAYGLYIPTISGHEFSYLNSSENSNIYLEKHDLYFKSTVYYMLNKKAGTEGYTGLYNIAVQYIEENNIAAANEKGVKWYMDKINPYGSSENYPRYSERRETRIKLQDREVQAVVGAYSNNNCEYIHFVYDDAFVTVCGEKGKSNDADLFSKISFIKVKKSDMNQFEALPPAKNLKRGDPNMDGLVNVADSVMILQFIANSVKYPITGDALECADVDGMDGVTGSDAILIQKSDAGLIIL